MITSSPHEKMSTTSSSNGPSDSREISFSDGWEMPDLRSPRFSQRPKCAGVANHENGLFYPEQHRYQKDSDGLPMTPQVMAEISKDFCHGRSGGPECPVRIECLEWALENRQRHGVWGGMSEPERSKLHARRQHEVLLAASLVVETHEQFVARTRRGWSTRRRRAAERARGYWVPEAEEALDGDEEVRRGA